MMETKGMDLKPCPFCGSEKVIFVNSFAGLGMWVTCKDCAAIGPTCQTKEEAESAWNRRYEPPNEPLTLDELWQMGGEPVWVCDCDRSHGSYALVSTRGRGCVDYDEIAEFNDYGIEWLAYRRKPKEETL